MVIYDRTRPHLNIWNIRNVDWVIKFNPAFIPEKLKQLYREKFWIPKNIDVILSPSGEKLTEENIYNILLFFQWGFSDSVMFNPKMKSYLIEENWILQWYFSNNAKTNEMDRLLENALLSRWLSYEEIVNFLISRNWRWFIDEFNFEGIEDAEWNNLIYDEEKSIKIFKEWLERNLDLYLQDSKKA